MKEKEQPDEYWKKNLTQEVYEVLRLGKAEEPNTGKYVKTKNAGIYLCAGCKTPVLNSTQKVDDDSGYATFKISQDEERVRIARTYSMVGDEKTNILCNACSGILGTASNDMIRSADNLEQGTTQDVLAYIHSDAVVFKKALTPKNYPLWYLLVILIIASVGVYTWSSAGLLSLVAQHENIDSSIHLWVGDNEITATTVHLDSIDTDAPALVLGEEAIFIILSQKENAPQLRLPSQSVDVLWLNEFYKVVQGEQGVFSDSSVTLKPPKGAVFGLVTRVGVLPENVFLNGYEIIIVDKTELF